MKIILVVLVTVFISFQYYNIAENLIPARADSYAGHQEAAEWMKANIAEDTPIFAGSPRMVRAFTGRDYYQIYTAGGAGEIYGGPIWYLRGTRYTEENGQANFEEDLNMLVSESDVYVEIDVWEYTQASWYYPLSQDGMNYFFSLGFYPAKVVERNGGPVIFILKKDQVIN